MMAIFGDPEGKIVFSLSHGRHCDEEIFYDTQEELAKLGYPSISHTYDVEMGKKTVKDHALQRDKEIAESGACGSISTGWSWGANPAMWPTSNDIPIVKIIAVGGAYHPDIVAWADGMVPQATHDLRYDAYEHNPGPEAFKEIARTHIFTGNESDEVVERWARKMREHPRLSNESVLEIAPTCPIDYIILLGDLAILNELEIARGLGKKADVTEVRFNSDHAPMVHKSREFAKLLVARAVAIRNVPVSIAS
jgi:hypothetical protein